MNKDRIKIEGVWYVKEDTSLKESIEVDPTHFEGCFVENDEFCFEANRILRDNGTPYPDVDIKFTDKRFENRKDWKVENWDNTSWIKDVLNDNPESLEELPADMDTRDIHFFQAFLQYLQTKGWL